MKELSNLKIAMLSPVKRQIYLKRRERARIKDIMERLEVIPFYSPINGYMFWLPSYKARAMAEAFSNVATFCKAQKQLDIDDILAECEEES